MTDWLPFRRRPVHHGPLESREDPVIFVTVCTARRRPILADGHASSIIVVAWEEADNWLVGRYVILPDHIHLFCTPNREEVALDSWVRYWKALVTRRWPSPAQKPLWQPHFWDTQLRDGESYEQKWEYVRWNPVRHGLVVVASDWPYAGELNRFLSD